MKNETSGTHAKRPVNLFLNEENVQRAKRYTDNLSATVDTLLADFVSTQDAVEWARQKRDDATAEAWNRFESALGSFADDHSTL